MNPITTLSTPEELDRALEGSRERPAWLFKHSLICSVSTMALDEYRAFAEECQDGGADLYLIEIQRARPVSRAAADRIGVRHESPQVILLSDGRGVWSASHWNIRSSALESAHADLVGRAELAASGES